MSIRLRLTLLYSAILALTLVAFSVTLYLTQARTTLNASKKTLAERAAVLIDGPLAHHPLSDERRPPPTKFSTLLQIRTLDGAVLDSSPNLREALNLPLTDLCLQTVRRGETWVSIETLDTEPLLIHSQPFTDIEGRPLILQMAVSLAEREQNLQTLGRILIVGSIIAVVAAFGIGWLLAGLSLRPINRLRLTAQAIGAERDFNRRVVHTGPKDEIDQLATTFNDMLGQLQAAYLQIEESLQTQRRFVADASHELRTPLTTLRGNLGLLRRRPPISTEDQADVLADMVDETERLMRLVNDLLVLARVDAQRPLQQKPVPLRPLLEDVHQQIKVMAPTRTIHCQSNLEATIEGDYDALKQVLLALLDNALKYTPPEATVSLSAAEQNGDITLHVSDNGPGIAPGHLPHIFNRFYRADTARSSPGTGLGLAIAAELTGSQQGNLSVESELGRGSTFTLRFPRASADKRI